jgi:hypothetical protein
MADRYSFVSEELVTQIIPPTSSVTEHQVTAQALRSGVGYVARFPKELYVFPDEVALSLNALADGFDTFSAIPGVDGIAAIQEIDTQNQIIDRIDVTVVSTSGKSSTVFRTYYPTVDLPAVRIQAFEHEVARQRAILDAVEGA